MELDRLRDADFVKFKSSGQSREKQPDGSILEASDGSIDDVLKHSITLCHVLEADGADSLPKGSSRSRYAAHGGFTQPVWQQQDSLTAVNGGNGENWSGVGWDAIEITFLSDERVQIRNSQLRRVRDG
jgi:hypothetical protein